MAVRTVGIEEELLLLDPASGAPVALAARVLGESGLLGQADGGEGASGAEPIILGDRGPLVGLAQRRDVLANLARLRTEAELVAGEIDNFRVIGADAAQGAFLPPVLLHCADPRHATGVHEIEAFGPVCTVMGYDGLDDAVALANRGGGSLVASIYTHDAATAAELTFGIGSFHGRMVFIDRDCAREQTGHGSPLPQIVHGGPGRAGGG